MRQVLRIILIILFLAVTLSPLHGQNGTSGRRPQYVASSFLPSDLGNFQIWLEPENISPQTDGTAVGTWPNSSGTGSGYDATQSTSANKPTLKTNIVNGKNVVRFDGTNDEMSTSSGRTLCNGSGEASVYLVVNDSTPNPGAGVAANWLFADDGGGFTLWELSRYNSATSARFRGFNTAATSFAAQETVSASTWHVLATVRSASSVQFWVDNASASGSTATTGTNQSSTRPLRLGSNGFGGNLVTCDMGDVLVYAAAHTTTERQNVQTYLATKYNIALN